MLGLWRHSPQLWVTGKAIPIECIFASGRQALVQAMQELGLSRVKRVAYPEFSSACVISTIGKVASPIPLQAVLDQGESVDAVLLYEQWGWPISSQGLVDVQQRFPTLILDCVDSPDALWRQSSYLKDSGFPVVISLSKCLGLVQGGLLWHQQQWQGVNASREPALKCDLDPAKVLDLAKTYVNAIDDINEYADSDIEALLNKETVARQKNLKALVELGLCFDWPKWMLDVVGSQQGAPGIAPLFSSYSPAQRQQLKTHLAELGVTTEIYNFNFSGHPLEFDYRPCLAFPIHSELVLQQPHIQSLAQFQ